jgi:hypothetical protein
VREQLRVGHVLDAATAELCAALEDRQSRLIEADVAYVATRDIDQSLWKLVHYRAVEEHRRTLRRVRRNWQAWACHTHSLTHTHARAHDAGQWPPAAQGEEAYMEALGRFQELAMRVSGYYASLVQLLQRQYGLSLTRPGPAPAPAGDGGCDARIVKATRQVAHRCYIYLGDLGPSDVAAAGRAAAAQ